MSEILQIYSVCLRWANTFKAADFERATAYSLAIRVVQNIYTMTDRAIARTYELLISMCVGADIPLLIQTL